MTSPAANVVRQASAAATALRLMAEASLPHALADVGKQRSELLVSSVALELLVFGLHLSDRLAFQRLGDARRCEFMSALLPNVEAQLDSALRDGFRGFYAQRVFLYAKCENLFPSESNGDVLKDTLFWEFGKVLSRTYGNSNPVGITMLSNLGATIYKSLLEAYGATHVLAMPSDA